MQNDDPTWHPIPQPTHGHYTLGVGQPPTGTNTVVLVARGVRAYRIDGDWWAVAGEAMRWDPNWIWRKPLPSDPPHRFDRKSWTIANRRAQERLRREQDEARMARSGATLDQERERPSRSASDVRWLLDRLHAFEAAQVAGGSENMDFANRRVLENLRAETNPAALPQPEPTGDGVEILGLVMRDLEARARAGRVKYGTTLRAHNGRDPLMDAYQEALDLAMYLRQAIEERA